MDAIPECAALKELYSKCYNEWASKKIGDRQLLGGLESCNPLFEDFKMCYTEGMRQKLRNKRLEAEKK